MRGPEKVKNNIVDKGKPEQKQESGKISRKTGRSEKWQRKSSERKAALSKRGPVFKFWGTWWRKANLGTTMHWKWKSEEKDRAHKLSPTSLSVACIQDFTVGAVKYCWESFPFLDISPPYVWNFCYIAVTSFAFPILHCHNQIKPKTKPVIWVRIQVSVLHVLLLL